MCTLSVHVCYIYNKVYSFLHTHVLSHCVVVTYKTDTHLPVYCFALYYNPKYLNTTHCGHSALRHDHQPKTPTPHPLTQFSVSVWTSSPSTDLNVNSSLEISTGNYPNWIDKFGPVATLQPKASQGSWRQTVEKLLRVRRPYRFLERLCEVCSDLWIGLNMDRTVLTCNV
jgi:hypothetical protein